MRRSCARCGTDLPTLFNGSVLGRVHEGDIVFLCSRACAATLDAPQKGRREPNGKRALILHDDARTASGDAASATPTSTTGAEAAQGVEA